MMSVGCGTRLLVIWRSTSINPENKMEETKQLEIRQLENFEFAAFINGRTMPELTAPTVAEVREKIKLVGLNPAVFELRA